MSSLILDAEQQLLAEMAARFVTDKSPVSRVRSLRDSADELGFSRALWAEMAELGWLGICIPEAYGGLGMGFFDLCLILEALGRNLAPEPFLSTILLGAQTLLLGGSEAQKQAWLPGVSTGERLLTLAYQEADTRYDLQRVSTTVRERAEGFVLDGEKVQVLDGHVADGLIVTARVQGSGELNLFLVETSSSGVDVQRQQRVDGRNAAIVCFRGVELATSARVGGSEDALPLLEQVMDRACVGLAAEMLGLAHQAFDDTLAYLKERVQFGVPIGSFQALQHRAARLFVELTLAESGVRAASRAVDQAPDELPKLASLAKATCSELVVHVTNEAVQLHGGIGMTDEHDIGFYMKRARAADATFGDAAWHRRRWASLQGY